MIKYIYYNKKIIVNYKSKTDVTANLLNPTVGIKTGSLEMLETVASGLGLGDSHVRNEEPDSTQLHGDTCRMTRGSGSDPFIPIRPHPLENSPNVSG